MVGIELVKPLGEKVGNPNGAMVVGFSVDTIEGAFVNEVGSYVADVGSYVAVVGMRLDTL